MPLRALVDGREVQVWELTGVEWTELKRRTRTATAAIHMACCGTPAVAKTSRSGNPFFAHRPEAGTARPCRWARESTTHAFCKLQAAAGARAAGWEVQTEAAAEDRSWRADVLCRRGRIAVALEIQLARTGLDDLRRRQERYARAGVRGAWFLRPLLCPEPSPALPAFALELKELDGGPARVWLGSSETAMPLGSFVAHLLRGQIRFEAEQVLRPLHGAIAVTAPSRCRRCAGPFEQVVGVTNLALALPPRYRIDGAPITALRDLWLADRRLAGALIAGLARLRRGAPSLSPVAPRRCPVTGETYLMAGCPCCGVGQGDGTVDWLLTSLHPRALIRVPIPPAPLTFRPLDGRPPRLGSVADWLQHATPPRWSLSARSSGTMTPGDEDRHRERA